MTTNAPGRPRLTERRRPGATPREEVLDAAGELFTTRGYAATSTRRVADAVGIRQASLYHYFRTKDDILAELLSATVVPQLAADENLTAQNLAPDVHLHALALFDATELWTSPWNLGILYLLPEVRTDRFAEFHGQRDTLRLRYRKLSEQVVEQCDSGYDPDPAEDVVFRLTETLPNLRADGLGRPDQPLRIADLGMHTLGWKGNRPALHRASQEALTRL